MDEDDSLLYIGYIFSRKSFKIVKLNRQNCVIVRQSVYLGTFYIYKLSVYT